MIVKAAARGRSFTSLAAYLTGTREGQHRAVWSSMENLGATSATTAAKIMAATALHADELKGAAGVKATGRKAASGEVYHAIMSWPEGMTPDHPHQLDAARAMLKAAGLDKAQAAIVAHDDNGKAHVHIMVNLVDPETGKRFALSNDHRKMDAWATEYAREHGTLHLTPKRAERAEKQQRAKAQGTAPERVEPAAKIGHGEFKRIERAASDDWQRRKAEREAAFARQGAERSELRAAHNAEWKTAKAEAAQHKAAYKAAFRAAYARHKAADKAANRPAWGALFKRQQSDRRSLEYGVTNARAQAVHAQQQARAAVRAFTRADRRKASVLGRLAQRVGIAATPESARADQRQAAQRMERAAAELARVELAKANLARRQEDERKALGAQLSQLTFAKAQLAVSNMPRADFAAIIERQNAERAEQIERQNAERAALGMKPYDPPKGRQPMQNASWEDRQRGRSASAFNEARKPESQQAAERPKVQGAERHFTPAGYTKGTTPAAPVKQPEREGDTPRRGAARFAPSNDQNSFTAAELTKASARFAPKDQATLDRANAAAETRNSTDQARDKSRDRDDFER